MFGAKLRYPHRLLLWTVLALSLLGAACGGDDEAEPDGGETVAEGEAAAGGEESGTQATAASAEGTGPDVVTTSTLPPPTTTTTTLPPGRRLGVVLLAPDQADNSLNFREGPGTDNPVVGELLPAQAGLAPTGALEVVNGRVWHELITQDTSGWAYGYYLTEIWSPEEVEAEWEWKAALDNFANALVLGNGLADTVSWRGLFVIYYDQNLRRWEPDELSGLGDDDTELRWSNTGASADQEGDATVGTWKQVIADPFLADYLDEEVEIEVGGLTLGANAVLPGSAISSAFANFPWVAIHDPGDNEEFGGLDWSTWLVFLEMEQGRPRVVGLQPQVAYP
ncbi:MAG: hypothetical protein F4Z79_01945 [Acidimicrobiia bacterium]|nr:hypothetical protein [Acidimicrobiia bacterium]MXY74354.1 hypothetical protein [Acidimicrobiia bacterium]MYD40620.1 hypothetical protein [Acidimicrobiia bacterium]MYG93214.1 hypothetical protein [Acidimicrobiia bacterium]